VIALTVTAGLHAVPGLQDSDKTLSERPLEADRARWEEVRDGAQIPRSFGFRGRSAEDSQVGFGPLSLVSQSPIQVLRLSLKPRSPITLEQGRLEFGWHETLVNVFAFKEQNFLFDHGSLMSSLSIAYGVTDSVQVELGYTDLSKFESIIDPLTDAYHELFGYAESGGGLFPSRDNEIRFYDNTGNLQLLDREEGSWSRDISFAVQHNLTKGSDALPAVSYEVTARAHAGGFAQLEGRTPFSVGVSGAAAKRIGGEFYTYLNVGHAWHGPDHYARVDLERAQWTGSLAFEWRYGPRSAWILQYMFSEGSTFRRESLNESSHEIALGWKREIAPGTVLEAGMIQNTVNYENSPDFGLHFGLRHRF
jgi:hypothetical protein